MTGKWSIISDPGNFYLGYFPGAGGSRFRRMLYGHSWKENPGFHFHQVEDDMPPGIVDLEIPKCPRSWHINWNLHEPVGCLTPSMELTYKLLTGHGMHVPTIRQVFPNRKTIKIYSNLRLSLRRWWVVFGKEWCIKNESPTVTRLHLSQSPMSSLENVIKHHLNYYSRFYDCSHDYAVYILPGENEFSDFMLDEFERIKDHPDAQEFDRCWKMISEDPRWKEVILDPHLLDPEFCRNRHEYLDGSNNPS